METTTQKKPTLLKAWSQDQHHKVEVAIRKHFRKAGKIKTSSGHGTLMATHKFQAIENFLGLAFTSSSSCAGLWVCNVDAVYEPDENYKYIGFAIGEDGKYYAILWDKDENEKLIEL